MSGSEESNGAEAVAGLSRQAVIEAMESNLWSLWSNFGRGPGCTLHDEGDALYYDTPIPTIPYNMVLRFAVGEQADTRIDAVLQHYRQRQVPCVWVLHPSAQPTDLGQRLRNRGLEPVETLIGMAAELADLPEPDPAPAGYEIREVCDEDEVEQFFELIAWRWKVQPEAVPHLKAINDIFRTGKPDAKGRCWLARYEGQPVAKVVMHSGGGTAGLFGVVTKEEARGQGLASILTLTAFKAAQAEGHRLAVLQSSPMAERLYARLGFKPLDPFTLYADTDFHV